MVNYPVKFQPPTINGGKVIGISPQLHVDAPGIFTDHLISVQMLKRVGCGKQREATASIYP